MLEFDERYHLHVGYYENNCDYEGVFFKVKGQNIWCLFFENDFYHITLSKSSYPSTSEFGTLVGKYNLNEEEMTDQKGALYLKLFLEKENII